MHMRCQHAPVGALARLHACIRHELLSCVKLPALDVGHPPNEHVPARSVQCAVVCSGAQCCAVLCALCMVADACRRKQGVWFRACMHTCSAVRWCAVPACRPAMRHLCLLPHTRTCSLACLGWACRGPAAGSGRQHQRQQWRQQCASATAPCTPPAPASIQTAVRVLPPTSAAQHITSHQSTSKHIKAHQSTSKHITAHHSTQHSTAHTP
jgi:hypothetical protein